MMSIIFNKFIKDEEGSVEIIESSLVYPFILLSLSLLFIISIMTIKKSIEVENIYNTNRYLILNANKDDIFNKIDNDDIKIEEEKLNDRISQFTYKNADIHDESNIFNLRVSTNLNGKTYTSSKYNLIDSLRKIDFLKEVLKDKSIDIEKFSIEEGLNSFQEILKVLLSRFK